MSGAELRALHGVLLTDDETTRPRPSGFLVNAFLALVLAELMVTFIHPGAGPALHAALLVAFTWVAVLEDGVDHDPFAALAVLPLIRVLAIAIPFWLVDQAQHFALVNVPLIAATLMAARFLRYGRAELGLTLGGLPLFRGVLQTAAVRVMGARRGIVYVSLMFGALHVGWSSAVDVGFVTLVGLSFGWAVHRTGSIVGVTLAHGIVNVVLFIVLPNVGG